MLKDSSKRRFDVVMAWADRLGRSLIDLLGTIQTLELAGVDLYLDQRGLFIQAKRVAISYVIVFRNVSGFAEGDNPRQFYLSVFIFSFGGAGVIC